MNVDMAANRENLFEHLIIIGIGINSTISISNTIKITANKKNRVENGIRAEFIGSKPHSNGEFFSRSIDDRIKIRLPIINRATGIKIEIEDEIINIFIN